VQLPLGASDLSPVERLDAIVARTRAVKQELHTGSAEAAMLHSILVHALPGLWEQMGWREAPMLANLVVSNPFGFPDKRFLMGAEIEVALPVSVVAPGQVLNITAVNVEDRYQIAFIAIAEGVLDVDLLAQYTQEAFATLASALGKKRRTRRTRGGTKSKQKTTQ